MHRDPERGYGELIHLTAGCHLVVPSFPPSARLSERLLPALRSRRSLMTQLPADPIRPPRFKKARAAALGFGLGATLALSPLVWAQSPPADTATTQTPSVAIPQQSFAPLVKRVLPAVVNISVTEKSGAGAEQLSGQVPEDFRGAPFDDFLR